MSTMFPTFTGNARRTRQVNLSGRHVDPFAVNNASSSSSNLAAPGTHKTVLAAQLERMHRQEERQRLSAAKTIQRIWRGYKLRKDVENERRQQWDHLQSSIAEDASTVLPDELSLLVSFINPRQPGDIHRLAGFGDRLLRTRMSGTNFFQSEQVDKFGPRLLEKSLQAVNKSDEDESRESVLRLLKELCFACPEIVSTHSLSYYQTMSRILASPAFCESHRPLLLDAIRAPLTQYVGNDHPSRSGYEVPSNHLQHTYVGLGLHMLTKPTLGVLVGLDKLAETLDTKLLSSALLPAVSTSKLSAESRLWLMANFVAICRLQSPEQQGPEQFRLLSFLFSDLADKLVGRVDWNQPTTPPQTPHKSVSEDDEVVSRNSPLPEFVVEQVNTLVCKDSLTTLFSRFQASFSAQSEDAVLLASFALNLLRVFQHRGDEIRMWLVYSTMSANDSTLPAIKYFWKAAKEGLVLKEVCTSTEHTLSLLQELQRKDSPDHTTTYKGQDLQIVMLFLELYAFALRFTDDEEFLAGGSSIDPAQSMSRFAKSSLPLEDVKRLTTFLKNLVFTLIFHADVIFGDSGHATSDPFTYLVTHPTQSTTDASIDQKAERKAKENKSSFSGISGAQVKEVSLAVLRALYERDSRRQFLPTGHWLMTSKFDMGAFIPAVVAEEERQLAMGAGELPDDIEEDDGANEFNEAVFGVPDARLSRAAHVARIQNRQRQQARKRVLVSVGPRLEILQNMPFVIPFNTRVQIFDQFVMLDKLRRRGGFVSPHEWRSWVAHGNASSDDAHGTIGRHTAKIRRQNIFADALDQFYSLGEGLKEPIKIHFVDQFDVEEAGIDGGGVTKEFLTSITKEAFGTAEGQDRFITNDQNLLYPNPTTLDARKSILREAGVTETDPLWHETIHNKLREYEFLGRVVGKCLYERILIDVAFAGFFLLTWAMSNNTNYRANVNDLRDLDEDLYRGLLKLKNYAGDVENDFGLDFTIEDVISPPGAPVRTATRTLVPHGADTPVTKDNRLIYITLVTRHRLQRQPAAQTRAFLRGLGQMIQPAWLAMFNQRELQTLVAGDTAELDLADLRAHTQYGGLYQIGDDGLEHPTVRLFWDVMAELDDAQRRKVLKYVTSTPRAPLLGFAELNPRFGIRDASGVGGEDRLPSAATCLNLLKLPTYKSKRVLREKLVYAVNSGAGFDLS